MPRLTDGETALLNAAEGGDLARVHYLASQGVNVNRRGVVSP